MTKVEIDQVKINDAIKAVSVAGDKIPYFLLLLTPGSDANSINVQAANQTVEELSIAVLFTKATNDPLTDVIKTYIESSTLNTLYNDTAAAASATPNADRIIELYSTTKNAELNTAVSAINTWISPGKLKDSDSKVVAEGPLTLDALSTLLRLSYNEDFLANAATAGIPFAGGSRSMKHRRRHKQKKNKNTKRRNRK
jgi:hypothetical protein